MRTLRTWVGICCALLTTTVLAASPAAAAPPAALSFGGTVGSCTSTHGALVAVDFGPWTGQVLLGCDTAPSTGINLLTKGGFSTAGDQHDGPQFICRIGHLAFESGAKQPRADQDACVKTPPASAYWSYWTAKAGQATWTYSQLGAYADHPSVGEVQAWVYGATDVAGTTGQPRFSPAQARAAKPLAVTAAFVAGSRSGSAVYINGLVKQLYNGAWVRGAGRSAYLQRYLNGSWQTMLERTADSAGQVTVGFVQTKPYQYRWYVSATPTAASVASKLIPR